MESADGYSIFNLASGEIRCQVGGLQTAQQNTREGEAILKGRWDDGRWYALAGSPVPRPMLFPRPTMGLPADGVAVLRADNVPAGTRVRVDRGEWGPIDDGVFEFVTAIAGEYAIDLEPPFPFQHQTVRVIAHAP
ncbi:hypothetical protein [Devosia sp. 1635]|uniref:hypothetical protein n=1 Tax=Devosia sp. 1635 TaxID=2726066 RepID=UPI00156691C7|nr:hypothetical protein [Devosia sp. 1635]